MASSELLAHITTSAPLTASSGCAAGATSMPSVSRISCAKVSRCSRLGLKARTSLMSRTAQIAINCAPACQLHIGVLHHRDAVGHGQELLDIVVGQDQSHCALEAIAALKD